MSDKWSDDELRASVEAYLDMQRKHCAGEHFAVEILEVLDERVR